MPSWSRALSLCFVFFAGFNPKLNESVYTKTHGSGTSRCDHCANDILQGHYFRELSPYAACCGSYGVGLIHHDVLECRDNSCKTGKEHFDICYRCHEKGLSCRDNAHKLSLILAYDQTRQQRDIYNSTAFCDACKTDMEGDYWLRMGSP